MQPATSPLEENNKRQVGTRTGRVTIVIS